MELKEEEKTQTPDGSADITADITASNGQSTRATCTNPGRTSNCSTENDAGRLLCRVCHCSESDLRGGAALGFLGISPPLTESSQNSSSNSELNSNLNSNPDSNLNEKSNFIEFVSPGGEIFVCSTTADVEAGPTCQDESLINLGCSCKNDLAVAHYSCALKWFISHGSTICEICGTLAQNVRLTDFKKVLASLKDYDELRGSTAIHSLSISNSMGVDPDAVAGIRRQRLSEISMWFNPNRNLNSNLSSNSNLNPGLQGGDEMYVLSSPINGEMNRTDRIDRGERQTVGWALEGTGAFVTMGLVTVLLAWLVAPHVGKKAAVISLNLLLGGLCGLTIMIFLRFVVPRIQYGPTRYWAVSFVFWFLVFGVWASRTHNIRSS